MGGMIFTPQRLADNLSETAGYKAGLALSLEEMCDHLADSDFPELLRASEEQTVRLRSEEYEALFYKLLHRIGYTKEEYDGDYTGAKRFHKHRKDSKELERYMGVKKLFHEIFNQMMRASDAAGSNTLDPMPFLEKARQEFGPKGLIMAFEEIEIFNQAIALSPHSIGRASEWASALALKKLFAGADDEPEVGRFIDQRFINYLSNNKARLPAIHWRKFEELTAEFFDREGYQVKLGPGSNDEGVDVRVWAGDAAPGAKPLCLVQCKRQKDKIQKVVVKGLHADVQFEGAQYGVVVTTAELSPGARKTIKARGYPIQEVDRAAVDRWLEQLRTPGTGIVRV